MAMAPFFAEELEIARLADKPCIQFALRMWTLSGWFGSSVHAITGTTKAMRVKLQVSVWTVISEFGSSRLVFVPPYLRILRKIR